MLDYLNDWSGNHKLDVIYSNVIPIMTTAFMIKNSH